MTVNPHNRFGLITHRCLNSSNGILLGKPFLQIRIPSSTPLHLSWCRMRFASASPGFFISFGIIQRTKWGVVEYSIVISLFNCSLCLLLTVWKLPPFLPPFLLPLVAERGKCWFFLVSVLVLLGFWLEVIVSTITTTATTAIYHHQHHTTTTNIIIIIPTPSSPSSSPSPWILSSPSSSHYNHHYHTTVQPSPTLLPS